MKSKLIDITTLKMDKKTITALRIVIKFILRMESYPDNIYEDLSVLLRYGDLGYELYDVVVLLALSLENCSNVIIEKCIFIYEKHGFTEISAMYSQILLNENLSQPVRQGLGKIFCIFEYFIDENIYGMRKVENRFKAEFAPVYFKENLNDWDEGYELQSTPTLVYFMVLLTSMYYTQSRLRHRLPDYNLEIIGNGRSTSTVISSVEYNELINKLQQYNINLKQILKMVADPSDKLAEMFIKQIENYIISIMSFKMYSSLNDLTESMLRFELDERTLCNWTIAMTDKEGGVTLPLLQHLLSASPKNLLTQRVRIVREKGIQLQFENKLDCISRITLSEIHRGSLHYIKVTYIVGGDTLRNLYLNIENIAVVGQQLVYELDGIVLMMVLKWLGVAEYLAAFTAASFKVVIKQRGIELGGNSHEELYRVVQDTYKNFLSALTPYLAESNITYTEPKYLNYTYLLGNRRLGARSKENGEGNAQGCSSTYTYQKMQIGRHIRKLPVGQKVSDRAIQLANQYCIDLRPGYTLVDDFYRKVKLPAEGAAY